MKTVAPVRIHSSQFPDQVQRDLVTSLRSRCVNHKFHYDSVKQTQKWLALHEAHSPARYDADVLSIYEQAFAEASTCIPFRKIQVIGLGCGGGQKDVQLIKRLRANRSDVAYTPCDVSVAMVLVALQAALAMLPAEKIQPFVCDLATAADLAETLAPKDREASRLVTFFGMIPNFEPNRILPNLAAFLRRGDYLLFSANLAPGSHYADGMNSILPQYDNALTRDWLLAFLYDLGVQPNDGRLRFAIEKGAAGLQRVVARFQFGRARRVQVATREFTFARGEAIRLFFSYRYTPSRAVRLLAGHGLRVRNQWVAPSGEEGIFLCQKTSSPARARYSPAKNNPS